MEWEIPIPPVKGTNTRDYTLIQRAWSVSLFFSFSFSLLAYLPLPGGTP